jgi:uncharacterized protein (DUF2344 family)
MTKDQQIKDLEKKIKKLEKVIDTQKKLIEVLKTMPSNKNVKLKANKRGRKANGLSKGTQGKSGPVANEGSARESENSGTGTGSNAENAEAVEDSGA